MFSGEICVVGSAFYGMVAYAVTVTAVLGLFGIRVGNRFVTRRRHRSGLRTHVRENSLPLPVLEGGQQGTIVDLVPERRAPPNLIEDELFEDVVGRVLLGSRLSSNNPFQF
jgi:hypothetical protein